MRRNIFLGVFAVMTLVGAGLIAVPASGQQTKAATDQSAKAKTCRMEQQCHWENFKKICTYVKVCR